MARAVTIQGVTAYITNKRADGTMQDSMKSVSPPPNHPVYDIYRGLNERAMNGENIFSEKKQKLIPLLIEDLKKKYPDEEDTWLLCARVKADIYVRNDSIPEKYRGLI